MANVIESGIGTLNYGRQSAKGTPANPATTTTGFNQPKWADGYLSPNKQLGSAEFIDGQRFGSPSIYTDSVGGEVGSLSLQLQPENAGLFSAAILGIDTVTGSANPYTHTITSAGTSGHFSTWYQKVGSAIGPERQRYSDCKIAKLALSSTFADKCLKADLDIQCLAPAQTYTTDAAKTQDSSDPYFHTEATGSFSVDSTVINEVTESMLEVDTMMKPFYGDSIQPLQLIEGKGLITRSVKSIVTDDTLGKFRKAVYNSASPTSGTDPNSAVFYAAITNVYTRSATQTLTITTPRVAIDPATMNVAPRAEGGEIELSLGGTALKNGATAALTIVALSADATTYA